MVNLVKHDLEFMLKQIKIAEAHSAGTELTEIYINADGVIVPAGTPGAVLAISDPLAPYGLRIVDGSYNNLVAERDRWGAADEEFLRLTTPVWRNETDDSITFGAGTPGQVVFTDGNYGEMGQPSPASMGLGGGTVVDADPRTISNLIVDQTLDNPAAIYAALVYAGYSGADLNTALNAIVAAKMSLDAAAEAAANVDPGPIALLQAIVDGAAATDAAAQSAASAASAQAAADQAAYDASVTAAADAETARDAAASTYFALLTDSTPNSAQTAEIAAASTAYDAAEAAFQGAVTTSSALQQTAADAAAASLAAGNAAIATAAALAQAQATLADAQIAETNLSAAQTTLDTLLETHSIEMQGESVVIPNVAPDEGLSAPYNSWFTLFGQFFDHGLDLVAKSGNGTVYIPLAEDDPLYNPATPHSNFMVLTRTSSDAPNLTTPWVDQNQTYSSTASKQLFMHEYAMVNDRPVATGMLLEGTRGGLATWADVKAQARDMLGVNLTDADVTNIPLFVMDAYGEFVRGANGFPQLVVSLGADNKFGGSGADADVFIEGNPDAPISTLNAVRTGHAFLDDIAHAAAPVVVGGVAQADSDSDVGYANADGSVTGLFNSRGQQTRYDNELLDEHYITGDGRGNENIGLTAVHHIFHSEHNHLVDQVKTLALESGDVNFLNEWLASDVGTFPVTEAEIAALVWDGERLFQAARFTNEMEYQHLVFEEFARKVQPDIDLFVFNASTDINPAIFAEFAHVVYRFGHSMLTETVDRINHDGSRDDLDLFDAFLNPLAFGEVDGNGNVIVNHDEAAGAIIRGMTSQVGNEIDEFVTNVLRNQLLGIPLDLAALNLARGRDTGIPPLNEARRQFQEIANGDTQLDAYTSWTDFALNMKNPASIVNFIAAYGTHSTIEAETTIEGKRLAAMKIVFGGDGAPADRIAFLNATGDWAGGALGGLENVDLWVGGLAEKKMAFGGMLGSTFSFVFELQLENLQNGDRFYYLSRVQGLNLLNELENNSLAKMVLNNTDLGERGYAVPGDIFSVPDHVLYVDHNEQVKFGYADPTQEDAFLQALSPMIERIDTNNDGIAEFIRVNNNDHVLIQGTSGNDHIVAGGGDDSVWGAAGDDTIEAGYGVDKIHGGAGDDIITNNGTDIGETDMLHGEGGNDVIHAGAGLALIFGNEGQDFIITGPDGKEAFGGTGNDFILGGEGGDFLLGNEGDDWMEAGNGFDTTAGDNSELFFNSTINGHDVMFAGANEHDFDAESGDDIMVQGESVMRSEGMWGFDWAIHKFHNVGANDDLKVPIFTTDQQDILRDRFDAVEALSGWKHDDTLRGDDRLGLGSVGGNPGLAGAENTMVKHELTQAGVNRIEGMRAFLGNMIAAPGAGDLEAQIAFDGGNIMLGGGGNDTIEGRGGNDVIDGDRWLNVRIRIDHDGVLYTADGMTHKVYLESDYANGEVAPNAVAQFGGKTLDAIMLERGLNPGELSIVREIADSDDGSIDTVLFWDVIANYEITFNPDGSVTVNHVTQTAGVVDERGQNRVSDGIDRLTNIERLVFADDTIDLTPPTLELVGYDISSETYSDNFNTGVLDTNAGTGDFNAPWTELLDDGTAGGGSIRIDNGNSNALQFLAGNQSGASITRTLDLTNVRAGSISISVNEAGVGNGDDEVLEFQFAGDGVNFVTLDTFDGSNNGTHQFTIPFDQPFGPNAAVRFRVLNSLDNGESFTIGDIFISTNVQTPTATPSVDYHADYVEGSSLAALSTGARITEDSGIIKSARLVLTNATEGDDLFFGAALLDGVNGIVATKEVVGSTIVVTLTGDSTINHYQALMQSIAYRNTSSNPDAGTRVVEITVNDGFSDSNIARATFNVIPVNNAPNATTDNLVTNITGNIIVRQWMMLRNDTDAEGNPLSVTAADENDANFGITFANGDVTAARTDGDNTKDFTYTISDGLLSDTADVDITWDTQGTLSGSTGADIILGNGDGSTIDGNGGNDLIIAGGGNDNIDGDTGDDEIHWNVGDGRDLVNGGANTDTFIVNGDASAETFRIYTRAAAVTAGITGLAQATEIVITRNGTNTQSIIAELDNIEEIIVNTLDVSANDGNGAPNGGAAGGDSVQIIGNFIGTSLNFSTITINGESGDDTVDLSTLDSAHRVVFRSNGGHDTIVGVLRPQDVIVLPEGTTDYATTVQNGMTTITYGDHSVTFATPAGGAPAIVPGSAPIEDSDTFDTGTLVLSGEELEDLRDLVNDSPRDSSGYGNNEANPDWGAAYQNFIRLTGANYTDGAAGVRQTTLTPREISDLVSNQDNDGDGVEEDIPNQFGGSALLTFFGQYFDHGLDFVAKGTPGSMPIGSATFPISAGRSNYVDGTGVDPDGIPNNGDETPAEYRNEVSPYTDQNQTYGSHNAVTDLLRKWVADSGGNAVQTAYLLEGDLDATGRGLLPTLNHIRENYRIMTGGQELTSGDISDYDGTGHALLIDFIPAFVTLPDESEPQLDLDAIGHYFVAGDGRVNENVMLTTLHTIWARNHNFWVDTLKEKTGNTWTEAEYFEAARELNIVEYQRIVFTEFAEAMAGGLGDDDSGPDSEHGFEGYDPSVDASISVEFAQAAYRFGHSMLNEHVSYVDEDGNTQQLSLVQAFLQPGQLTNLGVDGLLAGAIGERHQAIDVDMVNALRNQLVGRPLDLAALNIFRGRDMGVAPFNQVRAELYASTGKESLRPYTGWADFQARNTIDAATIAKLMAAYPDGFETMDLWIGGLAEKPMHGQLGSTFGHIFLEQLDRLQHGDSHYYLEVFDDSLFENVEISFSKLIARNTGLTDLPENVFQPDALAPDVGTDPTDDDEDEDDDGIGAGGDDDDDDDQGDDDSDDDESDDDSDDEEDDDSDDDSDDDNDDDDDDAGAGQPCPPPGTSGTVGTELVDVMTGTADGETIMALGGRDIVFAGGGDDNVLGGNGADMLYGDAGNDRILGGAGNDFITGGAGNDTVFGEGGDDLIVAEASDGNDTYYGDGMDGGTGVDTLDMSMISANITADLGTGFMGRGSASSTMSGSDTIWGIENIVTGSGNDTITASGAANIIDGGSGNDTFRFLSAADANGDTILGFQPGDKLDLSGIDANGGASGNQSFSLVSGAFSGAMGELLVTYENRDGEDYTVVQGNTSGDAQADFKISIKGSHDLAASDFNL